MATLNTDAAGSMGMMGAGVLALYSPETIDRSCGGRAVACADAGTVCVLAGGQECTGIYDAYESAVQHGTCWR